MDIKELIDKLIILKRCDSAILELWTPPETEIRDTIGKEERWANESIEYLKTICK